ncbi:MAG: hypothetical protein ACJ8GN_05805 [Longimicrobiaceae bacterium]
MKTRLLFAAAAILALASCDRAITAEERVLQGTWRADKHFVDLSGSDSNPKDTDNQLTFGPGGAFASEYFAYGSYGRPVTELTTYFRSDGEYRLKGNSLKVRVVRITSQDVQFAEHNVVQWVDREWLLLGTVEVNGDRLTIHLPRGEMDVQEMVVTYTRVQD